MSENGHLRVAFQGEAGAFSEEAARKLLGQELKTDPYRTFDEMFDAVSFGAADCLMAPIENSLAGSVHKNYDLLQEHDLTIVGEVNLRIIHNLVVMPGVELSDVRTVYSHPVALAQCEKFLRSHPALEASPAYDTAGSVKMIIETGRRDCAAIAGSLAASRYGGEILVEAIEDNPKNFTRFLLLTRPDRPLAIGPPVQSSDRKTTIVFTVTNRPGALFRALAVFALRDIDLSKIESRPIPGRPWEYSFYLDLTGDAAEPNVARALAHLREIAESVRILGAYPSAEALG